MQKQNITAIIYSKRGRVLAIGKNSYVHSCQLQRHHATKVGKPLCTYSHAEIDAINRCDDLTKAHRIVITRIKRDGTHGLAAPCNICASAIESAGIKITEWSVG